MAQRIRTTLTDDLDPGRTATGTVVFGLDGTGYEIDLDDAHTRELRDALAPFLSAARPTGGSRGQRPALPPPADGPPDDVPGHRPWSAPQTAPDTAPETGAVRAWAQQHDIAVSARGRIKGSVVAQFLEATS